MSKKSAKFICPVCKKKDALFFLHKNDCDLYRCQNCGLIFVWPIKPDHLEIYQKDYFCNAGNQFGYVDYDGDKEIIAENFKKYLNKLGKFCSKKGRLLDVGAATGNFIELANNQGWDASGIEVTRDAAEIGKKNNLDIINGNFEVYGFAKSIFDVITLWDVLEHFAKPELAIDQASKTLKSGGLLAINTPDSSSFLARFLGRKWHLLVPPEHLNCFSLKSIEILLERNDFEILHTCRIGKRFSLRYIFKMLAGYNKFFLWKKIYNYLMDNYPGEVSVSLNTGDNIFIIARKK